MKFHIGQQVMAVMNNGDRHPGIVTGYHLGDNWGEYNYWVEVDGFGHTTWAEDSLEAE